MKAQSRCDIVFRGILVNKKNLPNVKVLKEIVYQGGCVWKHLAITWVESLVSLLTHCLGNWDRFEDWSSPGCS